MNPIISMPQNKEVSKDSQKLNLLKDVFFKDASNEEFMLFTHACERSGLDPFMKQIYPVKRWDNTLKRNTMTIQTGIDGYRLIAERTGRYCPGKEPIFEYDKNGNLFKATAYVKKLTTDGVWHDVPAFAYFEEYCQRTKEGNPTSMWAKMPHSQLAKCAEALALRKAFPNECSGIYTKEEMDQAEIIEIPASSLKPPSKSINAIQAESLKSIFSQCDPTYESQVMEHLKRADSDVDSIEKIPESLFDRIHLASIKNRDKYQQKLDSEAMEVMHD